MAIRLHYCDYCEVEENLLNSTGTSTYYGIYLCYCDGDIKVHKNYISDVTESGAKYGIYMYYCYGTSSNRGLLANNSISIKGGTTSSAYGIYSYYNRYINFYHNSVNMTSPYVSNSYAVYLYGSSSSYLNLVNNVFVHSAGGYSIYFSTTTSTLTQTVDYNDLYTTGAYIGRRSSTNYATLANWRSATGRDYNSISEDPLFSSPENLHLRNLSPCEGIGTNLSSYVPDDIDDEIRCPLSGCPGGSGNPDIGIDEYQPIANDAGVTEFTDPDPACDGENDVWVIIRNYGVSNLNSVQIRWTVNGVEQTPFSWTGTITPGAYSAPINIGSLEIEVGTTYNFEVWTFLPNGFADGNTTNDNLFRPGVMSSMGGAYTIGGSDPDYTTFNDAITDLVNYGVCDSVVFNVRSGTYNEQITLPIVGGTSVSNNITFQSETGDTADVRIEYFGTASDPSLLVLDRSQYSTFRNMTLRAIATSSYANVVALKNFAQYNTIDNCRLVSRAGFSGTINSVVMSINNDGQANTISNCNIIDGAYGVFYQGLTVSDPEESIMISGNNFINQRTESVHLLNLFDFALTGNTMASTYATATAAISIDGCSGDATHQNYIANNMAQSYGDGIKIENSNNVRIIYNTVNVTGSAGTSEAFEITSPSTNNILINNILANTANGYIINIYGAAALNLSDYNDYYKTGATIGVWSGSPVFTLTELRSYSGSDMNSMDVDPLFLSSTDFHIEVESPVIGNATPLTDITYDIDYDARDLSSPDIGADEENSQLVWTGLVSTEWFDPDNWEPNSIPTHRTYATIPADPASNPDRWPVYTGNIIFGGSVLCDCLNLNMQGSSQLAVIGKIRIMYDGIITCDTLGVVGEQIVTEGDWENDGTFTAGNSTVIFDGHSDESDPQIIFGSTTTTFYNIKVDDTAVQLESNQEWSNEIFTVDGGVFKFPEVDGTPYIDDTTP